ncbi:MAG: DEAD/DEAH box helicase [Micrococcales bacterium]|nr:DEAD/DEAH box helicase [Micrococcales bacterium]
MLRDYQQRTINQLYDWLEKNKGNPCLVLPTGSGKSHIVAALCKDAVQKWPETKILMLTHVKELIEQNAEKMRQHWAGAPLGIYSAGIGKRDLGEPITFAGIQSVRTKADYLGHIDLVIIDECHLVSHKNEGGYRDLLTQLKVINPELRVIGLTATPYRLGHGLITDKPAIFDDLIEPVSIEELIYKRHLATLRSKTTTAKLDTSDVKKRGGEFIESELQKAVDTRKNNESVVAEVIRLAGDRKSWLFFCAGINHAKNVSIELRDQGIKSACITGETPKSDRERIIHEFKSGKIRALTNANVLTTGFDAPNIDLIAMLRPTMSASLYVQMAGRGMRIKDHIDHCLVLDFAGVVETHGPITNVQPNKAGTGNGEAPVKLCTECHELCAISIKICPSCNHEFPPSVPKPLTLRHDDIMGVDAKQMIITGWNWRKHISNTSGKEMLAVSYYSKNLSDPSITEYLPLRHDGYAGDKAVNELAKMANASGVGSRELFATGITKLDEIARYMNDGKPPATIKYKKEGKFYRVLSRNWNE